MKNEADFSLSTPSKTDVDMVAPDLDIPGKIASLGKYQLLKNEQKLRHFYQLISSLSAKYNSNAVIINIANKFQIFSKQGLYLFFPNYPNNYHGKHGENYF